MKEYSELRFLSLKPLSCHCCRCQIEHIDNSVEQVTTNAFVENTITLVVNREVRSAAANALEATMSERKENLLMLKQQFTNTKIRKLFHQ